MSAFSLSRHRSTVALGVAGLALVFGAAACGSSSSGGTTTQATTGASSSSGSASDTALCGTTQGSGSITIGAANFSENETIAAIYADALNKCGYSATSKSIGSREVYYPALKKGQLQVVPEYAATLTDYINDLANGANAPSKASGNIATTMTALRAELPSNLAALNPAPATDKDTFAVTKAFSTAHSITTMSQLASYSDSHPLSLGGPAECPTRTFCEIGLKKVYGMKISKFKQLDAGGPLTIKAIKNGTVDFGEVFTSDPTVQANGLVTLTDDKNLQASDNIVPIVAKSLATGAAAHVLNAIDAKLSQTTLVEINKAVELDRAQPEQVAAQFLSQAGLG